MDISKPAFVMKCNKSALGYNFVAQLVKLYDEIKNIISFRNILLINLNGCKLIQLTVKTSGKIRSVNVPKRYISLVIKILFLENTHLQKLMFWLLDKLISYQLPITLIK